MIVIKHLVPNVTHAYTYTSFETNQHNYLSEMKKRAPKPESELKHIDMHACVFAVSQQNKNI